MSKNKITLLIPCYNKTEFLESLFKSILNQSDREFDLIFIDDKSTDNTLQMLQNFKKQNETLFNIKIIALEQNEGLARGRNRLIAETETDYFYFLDADDQLFPNTMKFFNQALKEKDFDIVYAKNTLILKNMRVYNFLKKPSFEKVDNFNNVENYLSHWSPFIWNKAYNKKFFLNSGLKFLEGYNFEDVPVTFNLMLLAKSTYFIDQYTYKYDLNLKGISKTQSPSKVLGIAKNMNYLYNELKFRNNIEIFERKMERFFFKNILIHLFSFKNYTKIVKNKEEFKEAMTEIFYTFKSHNIEGKLQKYKSASSFLFKNAVRNYYKLKKLYN
ncbi:glycosyltransferase family 2 protein [Mycoplasma procyoni]|uniref:glycosyltransferase family 2 protein n=1 Tax=Mycoplasma procyoni TaxID=568784 RepID=UPI00197BA802|nr:glycosyltransferase family 2 protein [Mycoplasma procyoni]MBN3534961.1 glycosyltransferase family 2 protein [Mycoplasma procyoni]